MDRMLEIFGGYKEGFDPIVDPQELGNWYLEIDNDAPDGYAFLPMPGSRLRQTIDEAESTSEVRALFTVKEFGYAVIGDKFYRFDQDLDYIELGTLVTSTGFVDWDNNLEEILLVDGAAGYLWDGSLFTNPSGFPADPISVTYLDGYFIVGQGSSSKFFRNENEEDGSSWQATDFAQITTDATDVAAVAQIKRRLFIFGETVTESWFAVGGTGFLFQRDNNIALEYGCLTVGSLVQIKEFIGQPNVNSSEAGFLVWLGLSSGGGPAILMTDGGTITPISSTEVELALQSFGDISDARAFSYKLNGHVFYVISFPTADRTFVYDFTTRTWLTQYMTDNTRYFGYTHFYINNKHYVGAYNAPQIYEISRDFPTYYKVNPTAEDVQNGLVLQPIPRRRITKHFKLQDGKRMAIKCIELEFRQGKAIEQAYRDGYYFDNDGNVYTDDEGEPYWDDTYDSLAVRGEPPQPVAYLSISADGGQTFNTVPQLLGNTGQTEWRTQWYRIGNFDSFIMKIEVFDNRGIILIGGNWDIDTVRR